LLLDALRDKDQCDTPVLAVGLSENSEIRELCEEALRPDN